MKNYHLFAFLCFLFSCKMNDTTFEVTVEKMQILDSVPSGSGIAIINDMIFMVGDDATALYKLPLNGTGYETIPFAKTDTSIYRLAKPLKHDLECLAVATIDQKEYLLAFGSGSLSPFRDSILVVQVNDPLQQQWIPAASLYKQLRTISTAKELNLEGVVISKDLLYLFNRSGNEVFEMKLSELSGYIQQGGEYSMKYIRKHAISLPFNARLSGGCMLGDKILFSASAENTPNAYDDGEIMGSFIGIIDPADGFKLLQFTELKTDGAVLKDKIESVDHADTYVNGDLKLVAVADNDNGSSKLFWLRLAWR